MSLGGADGGASWPRRPTFGSGRGAGRLRRGQGAVALHTIADVTAGEWMGWMRCAVGVALIAVPGPILGAARREQPSGAGALLLRTVGIRDLCLGGGIVSAARSPGEVDLQRWTRVALASDTMDLAASLAASRSIGIWQSAGAGALALVAMLGDRRVLRASLASGLSSRTGAV